jgi:DNA adenine methylase
MADKLQKPFLKWVGGKTQILDAVLDKFPKKMYNYHEPFLGGGSVLLAVLSLQKQQKIEIKHNIYAYDINKSLINAYIHLQQNKEELYQFIEFYKYEYNNIEGTIINRKPDNISDAKSSKESYYYWLRIKYNAINKDSIESSALFMFINKTCFRGMYREGPNGFNVPFGHYKVLPTIITRKELDYISDLIKDVKFMHSDFKDSILNIKVKDFVYFDPPYAPILDTSFVGYVLNGFDLDTHIILFNEIKKLANNNIKFVMSNAHVKLVLDAFDEYDREDIIARRAINSKNPGSTSIEVIIYN